MADYDHLSVHRNAAIDDIASYIVIEPPPLCGRFQFDPDLPDELRRYGVTDERFGEVVLAIHEGLWWYAAGERDRQFSASVAEILHFTRTIRVFFSNSGFSAANRSCAAANRLVHWAFRSLQRHFGFIFAVSIPDSRKRRRSHLPSRSLELHLGPELSFGCLVLFGESVSPLDRLPSSCTSQTTSFPYCIIELFFG